jgi:hypothetical protein
MNNLITHKLIQPAPNEGWLNDLILCWNYVGSPAPDQIRHTNFSTNINETNCPDCIRLWKQGVYQ